MPDSWYADLPAQFCSVPTYFLSLAWFGRPHCRTPLNSASVLCSICGAEPLTTQLHVAIDISRQNSKPVRHAHRRWRLSPTHFTFTGQSIHRTKPPRIVSCTLPVARTPLCLDDPICLLLLLLWPCHSTDVFPFPFRLPLRLSLPCAAISTSKCLLWPFGDCEFHSGNDARRTRLRLSHRSSDSPLACWISLSVALPCALAFRQSFDRPSQSNPAKASALNPSLSPPAASLAHSPWWRHSRCGACASAMWLGVSCSTALTPSCPYRSHLGDAAAEIWSANVAHHVHTPSAL